MLRRATIDDAEGIARVHVQSWRDTYPGIVPQAEIDRRSVAEYALKWREWLADPAKSGFVWDAGGRVGGFAFVGPRRETTAPGFETELYAIYVDRALHGRGVGRALFEACRAATTGRSMMLWVFDGNPAARFYARMGGRVLVRQPTQIGGATLWEIGYGWE